MRSRSKSLNVYCYVFLPCLGVCVSIHTYLSDVSSPYKHVIILPKSLHTFVPWITQFFKFYYYSQYVTESTVFTMYTHRPIRTENKKLQIFSLYNMLNPTTRVQREPLHVPLQWRRARYMSRNTCATCCSKITYWCNGPPLSR
jgi:hypothetical protein